MLGFVENHAALFMSLCLDGRGERIRTSDSCVPNAVLYQAELHPVFNPSPALPLSEEGAAISSPDKGRPGGVWVLL